MIVARRLGSGCFMLSGAALIVIGVVAALALNRTRGRDTISPGVGGHMRKNPLPPASSPARTRFDAAHPERRAGLPLWDRAPMAAPRPCARG